MYTSLPACLRLCINDFSLIEADAAPKMVALIQQHLLPHGAPIHCIGIQAHLTIDGINMTHMRANLDLLAGAPHADMRLPQHACID
jgi:GH35 family endo-1,4-beta-xylanase